MMPPFEILDRITSAYWQLLQERLVGIYLHGSMAMGCFTPGTGDMDLLVVVSDPLSASEARAMVDLQIRILPCM